MVYIQFQNEHFLRLALFQTLSHQLKYIEDFDKVLVEKYLNN